MKEKNRSNILIFILLSVVWLVIGWLVHDLTLDPNIRLMRDAYRTLETSSLYGEGDILARAAVQGMVSSTGDHFAAVIEGVVIERYRIDYAGEAGMMGLHSEMVGDQFIALNILPGGAAEAVGLQVGDVLISIDGYEITEETTVSDVGLMLRGPVGEPAEVVVQRDGEILTFHPIRQIRPVILDSGVLEGNVAYVAQHTFGLNATGEIHAILTDLLAQEPEAIIWDLRSNGGGSMEVAQEILSFFIKEGDVFYARLKNGQLRSFEASGNAFVPADIPIIVLVGEHTYSSAETMAISLQSHRGAILIGGVTEGKGTVQASMPLRENMLLKYTVAEWLSPERVSVHQVGIEPDIYFEDNPDTAADETLDFALEYLASNGK